MYIAFIGDIHGCALHALGAIAALRYHRQIELAAVIQVGDFGAFPSPEHLTSTDAWFIEDNPAQGDVFRVFRPDETLAEALRRASSALGGRPVLVLSGNHEDHDWLDDLHRASGGAPAVPLDPLGVFHHVVDGTVIEIAGMTLAFLGGAAAAGRRYDLDQAGLDALLALEPGSVDVLVTHDGPHGMCTNWQGRIQGSRRLTALIEHLQPRVHVSGHYHHLNGPRTYGATTSFALANLVPSKISRFGSEPINPTQEVTPGSVAVLDVTSWELEYITDAWLAEIKGDDLDLGGLLERYGF